MSNNSSHGPSTPWRPPGQRSHVEPGNGVPANTAHTTPQPSAAPGAMPGPASTLSTLASFRLDTNFSEGAADEELTTVPLVNPAKDWWVRTSEDPEDRYGLVWVLKHRRNGFQLVNPAFVHTLEGLCRPVELVLAVNSTNEVFVWPVPVPAKGYALSDAESSMRMAAQHALTSWTSVRWDKDVMRYRILKKPELTKEPTWPAGETTFQAILEIALRDRLIDSPDHPIIGELSGTGI